MDLPDNTTDETPTPSISDIPSGPASDSMQDLFDCKRALGILMRRLGFTNLTYSDEELMLSYPAQVRRDQLGNRKFEVQS